MITGRGESTPLDFSGIKDTGSEWTLIPGNPKHPCDPPVRVGAHGGQVISGILTHSFSPWVLKPAMIPSAAVERLNGIDIIHKWPNPFIGSND